MPVLPRMVLVAAVRTGNDQCELNTTDQDHTGKVETMHATRTSLRQRVRAQHNRPRWHPPCLRGHGRALHTLHAPPSADGRSTTESNIERAGDGSFGNADDGDGGNEMAAKLDGG
ncbi:hypothetical protein B0A50_04040 [Salinomyces thailandicus]|uniref:Uncharacterized protein n=1 Tax=Salinomyces thailandicus TaxID=706561 RepID=A0A4U0TZX1_9PEZI|nr:hypothetical protein B0A50_04040 [Salinomyces thailandica]